MQAWFSFLIKLDELFGKKSVDEWLRPLKIIRFDAQNLYLEAENPLQINWFEEHVRPYVKNSFFNNNGRPIQIVIQTMQKKQKTSFESLSSLKIESDPLNPEFTFGSYLPLDSSKMAYNLLSLPENIPTYNPIYLYGPEGSGKTHLVTAAAHQYKAIGTKIFYIHAETFATHVVQAIRLGQMEIFRKTYRAVDVLIVEDIHYLAKKNATQEEFFHTFNYLYQLQKQIIITSIYPPSQLTDIEPRLISRFEWGLILRQESVDPKNVEKILLYRLQNLPIKVEQEVMRYFATNFSLKSGLELFSDLLGKAPISESSLTLEKVTALLEKKIQNHLANLRIDDQKILRVISEYFGIKVEDILSRSHCKTFAKPRQLAMYFCRKTLHYPFMKIGTLFHRDHSTVMSSIRLIQKQLDMNDPNLLESHREISKILKC